MMSVVYVAVTTAFVLTVLERLMAQHTKIIAILVTLTAQMTVYRIVPVHGVAA